MKVMLDANALITWAPSLSRQFLASAYGLQGYASRNGTTLLPCLS